MRGTIRSGGAVTTLMLVLGMMLSLLVGTAAAGETSTTQRTLDNLSAMRATVGSSTYAQQQQSPTGSGCFADPQGDVSPTQDPRADIVEHCLAFANTLNLSVRALQPTDPETDPAWRNATFVGWFIDTTGDGQGEFFAEYSLDADSRLSGRVHDIRVPGSETIACAAELGARFDGGTYLLTGITASCIGNPQSVRTNPAIFYEPDPNGPRFNDHTPFPGPATVRFAPRATERVAGPGRIDTAVAISRRQFPQGASHVYLARADVFADAVAGGTLTGGPILLVPSCGSLPPVVRDEIARINPQHVIALGGNAAICQQLLNQAATGRQQGRLAGPTRIETALAISRAQFPNPIPAGDVYLSRADIFPDAVAGGHLTRGPILLVPRCGNPPAEVRNEITRLNPRRVVALGGVAAVCDETHTSLAFGRARARLAGVNRIETAVELSKDEWPAGAVEVYLARADLFADAVAAGSLTGGPILLVPSCGPLPRVVWEEIARVNPARVVALGGTAAVCDQLLRDAAAVQQPAAS